MEKTVCELFAGVGGFRCGLNHINTIEDASLQEEWKTVWFSQWEPADKKTQWAHTCYVNRFGQSLDNNGEDTTNIDISRVDKESLPDFNLLVGGFPCQDYSVANSLKTSKGIEGKKGVLWWSILDTVQAKQPPFILLENVDRLIKSPASQRGRDFGMILACLNQEGYVVEWRVINAAEYGFQQRRRRTFIFAYKNDSKYAVSLMKGIKFAKEHPEESMRWLILEDGFFAKSFRCEPCEKQKVNSTEMPADLVELSENFKFDFENSGVAMDGVVYTLKTSPVYYGPQITLGDIMEDGDVPEEFFIPENKLYYTDPSENHSDETVEKLPVESRQTWQYLKGAKKILRKAANGHEYVFSEGPIAMVDEYDKPARTMLTSEGSFSRTTHIVRDKKTGKIRLLTPIEMEHIQGFPTNWTKDCLVDGSIVEMPVNKRRFMMGNALVVNLIAQMEEQLSYIFEKE